MIVAYFAPPGACSGASARSAARGRARIITAAKSDNNATIAAARHSYSRLLRRHVEMYEYQPTKLHTKLVIVDDIVHIGSSNFDYRSLYHQPGDHAARSRTPASRTRCAAISSASSRDCEWITPELHKRRASLLAAAQMGDVATSS